jgi:hypothetical protein
MVKRIVMLAQFLLAGFLVKFLDADSDSGGSDSDSGGSDSDSGSTEGSSELSSSSSETLEMSDSGGSDSGDSDSQSSQRKKPIPNAQDLQNLPFQDLSQIPRRDE